MNPWFVLLLIFGILYRYLNIANVISSVLSVVKYSRMAISVLMPPKKGSVEYLRGGLLKITYSDPAQSEQSAVSVILPYSVPALHWEKVWLVTVESYQSYIQAAAEKRRVASTCREQAETLQFEKQETDQALASDLSDIAGTTIDASAVTYPKEVPSEPEEVDLKTLRHQIRDCEKEDVTELMLLMSGPGKDFFGIETEVNRLVPHARALIFVFGKKSKTFLAEEAVRF